MSRFRQFFSRFSTESGAKVAQSNASSGSPAMDIASLLVRFGSVVYCMKYYVGEVIPCIGPSMYPTINMQGDIIVLDRITMRFRELECGEIVIAKSPTNPRATVCKRIKAKEGMKIKLAPRFNQTRAQTIEIPPGHVWLEGDNATNSTDSRHYGPVPYKMILGRVSYRIWPFTQFTDFKN